MRNLLVALLTLTSSAALAQSAEPQTPAVSETQPTEATAAAEPTVDERMTTAEGKVAALEEQNATAQSDLSALKKLKISGYIQARYQYQESLDDYGTGGFSRFTVRRGRLKATYTTDLAQAMLQIDATPSGVVLKDAEATLFIPGTKQTWSLTAGQTKWPFGYEAPQSSSDREFPERSRVIRAFLPGERDRGVKLNGRYDFLRLNIGVFDGNGTDSGTVQDNDKDKDVIGRVGFDLKWIAGGVSGWYGDSLGKLANDEFRTAYKRTRIGADLQVYLDVLPIGGTALKGEFIAGKTFGGANNATNLNASAHGYWLLLVQNLGLSDAVAVRFDSFDARNGAPNVEANGVPGANNTVNTVGVLVQHYFGENLKVSAVYEIPMTAKVADAKDPKDNLFTLQMQARF
ncbi:porin [Corallococcus sp. H22C18031201]|uniref:porin n=1 Tax=Citreicoccus inhibens TaxID=2849499 RepID=UPI000E75CB9F|nr:porin [Citreicoccus inhibens]MBU8899126.1 OprO/OprP family phosphate-selective porin [Citreicoccus inhibens]RJS15201.1 porin [Corallococcus sp. H22C18031201]